MSRIDTAIFPDAASQLRRELADAAPIRRERAAQVDAAGKYPHENIGTLRDAGLLKR
ncbi:hypothetical protein AWB67_07328 [Caballeronia terrestris]|jgi:hypothetical protein|uniref:Acyl-CoA dehydrogenase n=1 Tax=Caballeronia terrestris TaxID=1226301 RepID=A0A158L1A2_9BURK|nr:hypothetical protein [Caballeronia terrestris]SAL87015.1 hypothetical protein AWB67_07328 [Caballeronia terrestris]